MSDKKDKRFDKVHTDPKFKPIPNKVKKVKLDDERFDAMFKDPNFISSTNIDEYGRKIKHGKKNIEMEKYYIPEKHVEEEEEEEHEESEEQNEEESDTSEEFQEFLRELQAQERLDQQLKEQENVPTGEESSRIAVMNIDWENIHAIDLFVLLNSFCKTGKVLKVEIYPSEYGIKEQEKENANGPDKEIFTEDPEKEGNDNDSEKGLDQVKLREYELKKLKYYYAVVTCDSVATASQLYKECDGMEIERTQSFMDLRFIPDTLTEFPYKPKEVCDHLPHDFDYVPKFRPNPALQDTKVKLTWDQTDPRRDELLSRAFHKEGFNQDDINELLVSSDEDDDEVAEDFIKEPEEEEDKAAFSLLKHKRKMPKFKEGETIEVKFDTGLEGMKGKDKEDKEEEKDKDNKSKWEQFKENKKNKRREKKMEERKHREEINEKRKGKTKGASKGELNLLVDKTIKTKTGFVPDKNDDRFKTDGNKDFAIDPTSKDYKKLKNIK